MKNKYLITIILFFLVSNKIFAGMLNLANVPLSIAQNAPPLTLIVMGKNHKLFYEAYNDTTDLNQDNILDIRYKPSIDYYGYFDSHKCYYYSYGKFKPSYFTSNKKCSGKWSGDYLNYLTTSRMDAIRKVLYGGYRSSDRSDRTELKRAYIPQDAHSWGKEYTSIAVDGYDIREYTPLSLPQSGKKHLFANTTLLYGTGKPLLRVAQNLPYRIWEWVSIERPVAGDKVLHGTNGVNISNSITDYNVIVRVCVDGLREENCRKYPSGEYKPIGLLQEYGENDSMMFGLLTGSYDKNLSGGVLRKNISSINDEIYSNTGTFTYRNGIIKTINKIKITGFDDNYQYKCGFIFDRDMNEGECNDWGNPIAEMMYEGVRYFAGKNSPTAAFTYSSNIGDNDDDDDDDDDDDHNYDYNQSLDDQLALPLASWQNPYDNQSNQCAKPNLLVISDTNPSYDSSHVPGSAFGNYSGDLPSLDVSSIGQTIWNKENNNASKMHYIGQSGMLNDGTPTPKLITSFGNIRGLAPEEPNKKGTYYSASMAYYGKTHDINAIEGDQNIHTFVLGLKSNVPQISIPVNGQTITLIPFAKSVGPPSGCLGGIDAAQGAFQPTNTIVDFYIEELGNTSGIFRVNFEDAQQGADHDMDAIVKYHYQVNQDNTVTINLDSTYAAGCVIQHIGYVISGTTQDGIYLEVRDKDTNENEDVNYFLDTPPGELPNGNWQTGQALPTYTSRTFTPGFNAPATILKSPLWYAAKWGGFNDKNNNLIPDLPEEFDVDNDSVPDNYFPVTNALNIKEQFNKALSNILKRDLSLTPITINQAKVSENSLVYLTTFSSYDWSGNVLAYKLDPSTGNLLMNSSGEEGSFWSIKEQLNNLNYDSDRQVITYNKQKGVAFRWPSNYRYPTSNEITKTQSYALKRNPQTNSIDYNGSKRLNYLRGDSSNEKRFGGIFRDRSNILGDIIHNQPVFIANPNSNYPNLWPNNALENNFPYSNFKELHANRTHMLYMGSNDGLLHAVNAQTGVDKFSYIPNKIFSKLSKLTDPNYNHQYYIDGSITISDVFINNNWRTILVGSLGGGGQGIFALDISDPDTINENTANNLVLWEFTDEDSEDLGYTYGKPVIARLANGKWAAIFGNGYNNTENDDNTSSSGNAVLYIVDIATGNLIKKFDTKRGVQHDPLNSFRPNGLASPAVVDVSGNHIADYVYVGDLFGNLWKINISSSDPADWCFSFSDNTNPIPLFIAKNSANENQPITSAPNIVRSPNTIDQYYVFFGTGKYLEDSDKNDVSTQSIYGLIDDGISPITSRAQLLQQEIIESINITDTNMTYRITSNYNLSINHKGWYLDLVENNQYLGERIISNLIVRDNRIMFATLIPPHDICSTGGSGWLMEINWHNGARLHYSVFDTNNDNKFDSNDFIFSPELSETVPPSGIKSSVGTITKPTIVNMNNMEMTYLSGSKGEIQTIKNQNNYMGRRSWKQCS